MKFKIAVCFLGLFVSSFCVADGGSVSVGMSKMTIDSSINDDYESTSGSLDGDGYYLDAVVKSDNFLGAARYSDYDLSGSTVGNSGVSLIDSKIGTPLNFLSSNVIALLGVHTMSTNNDGGERKSNAINIGLGLLTENIFFAFSFGSGTASGDGLDDGDTEYMGLLLRYNYKFVNNLGVTATYVYDDYSNSYKFSYGDLDQNNKFSALNIGISYSF